MNPHFDALAKAAISAAMNCNWEEAVSLNLSILKKSPKDFETLNRLAKACFELGELEKAKETYQKVLTFDPYNPIATKNLARISKISGNGNGNGKIVNGNGNNHTSLDIFLGEPGRTKLVSLVHLATPNTLSSQREGEKVGLIIKKHCVYITSQDREYLGAFPDDLSHLLISLINAGNQYEAFIKSSTPKSLVVLVREIFRSKKLGNQPSFIQLHKKTVIYERHSQIYSDNAKVSEEEVEEEIVEEVV